MQPTAKVQAPNLHKPTDPHCEDNIPGCVQHPRSQKGASNQTWVSHLWNDEPAAIKLAAKVAHGRVKRDLRLGGTRRCRKWGTLRRAKECVNSVVCWRQLVGVHGEARLPERRCGSAGGSAVGDNCICSVQLGGLVRAKRCAVWCRPVQCRYCTVELQVKDLCLVVDIHSE